MKNNPFSKLRNNLSFSPLRLFIIVNFIVVLGLIFLSLILSPVMDYKDPHIRVSKALNETDLQWLFLMEYLFDEKSTCAARFETDIKIQLSGDTIPGDFEEVSKIIAEYKPLIKTVNIDLVKSEGNFYLNFDKSGIEKNHNSRSDHVSHYQNEIVFYRQTFGKFYCSDTVSQHRYWGIRRHIVSNLTRSVKFKGSINVTPMPFILYDGSGPDFNSENNDNSYDKFVISKLYSPDFYQQLMKHITQKYGRLGYYKFRFKTETRIVFCILALVFLLIYFGLLRHFKVIDKIREWKRGAWFFSSFIIIQGIILASLFLIIDSLPYDYHVVVAAEPYAKYANPIRRVIVTIGKLYLVSTIILIVINKLQKIFIRKSLVSIKSIIRSFFIALLSCYGVYLLSFTITMYSVMFEASPFFYDRGLLPSIYSSNYGVFSWYIFFIIAFTPFVKLFIDYTSYLNEQRILAKDLELSHLREANTRAELLALHARINPHFLYNSLNSIAGLVRTDPERTEKVALSLSELFRHTLGRQSSQFILLKEEVDMVEHYLEIEKIRFGNRMSYEIRLPDNLKDFVIPRFMVLPLVENAVKHGVSQIPGDAFVKVEIAKHERELRITVYDNGPGFPELLVGGSGLQNLQDMLHLLYDDDYEMQWQNKPEKYIRLVLRKEIQEKPGK